MSPLDGDRQLAAIGLRVPCIVFGSAPRRLSIQGAARLVNCVALVSIPWAALKRRSDVQTVLRLTRCSCLMLRKTTLSFQAKDYRQVIRIMGIH